VNMSLRVFVKLALALEITPATMLDLWIECGVDE